MCIGDMYVYIVIGTPCNYYILKIKIPSDTFFRQVHIIFPTLELKLETQCATVRIFRHKCVTAIPT